MAGSRSSGWSAESDSLRTSDIGSAVSISVSMSDMMMMMTMTMMMMVVLVLVVVAAVVCVCVCASDAMHYSNVISLLRT